MHDPPVGLIVVDRVVLGAAVVPERQGAGPPAEAARELRPGLVAEEIVEDRRAFLRRRPLEAHGVRDVHVERSTAGLRMHAHDGMGRDVFLAGSRPR